MIHPITIIHRIYLLPLIIPCGISKDPGTLKTLIEVIPLDFKSLTALQAFFL